MGQFFAFEISKGLNYSSLKVETPFGNADTKSFTDEIVLATVLRAGLPLHQGMLSIFDKAENAFVTAYRNHHKDGTFEVELEYITSPRLDGKVLIISDPLLATGSSLEKSIQALLNNGTPSQIHLVTIIASTYGLSRIQRLFPEINVWVGDIDEELTAKSYIVPGMGDAGDLCFGSKTSE
jgi:uracil phosphoribosyltransferase